MRTGAEALHAQTAVGVLGQTAREDIPRAAIACCRAVVTGLAFTGRTNLFIFDSQFEGRGLRIESDETADGAEVATEGAPLEDDTQPDRCEQHRCQNNP